MTPELEAELNKIGWAWARRNPFLESRMELVLRDGAGMVATSPQEAKVALERHRVLCRSLVATVDGLRALTADAATSINLCCTSVEERDQEWPDHAGLAASALEMLAPGLIFWTELLEHEAKKARRGGRTNEPAYRIADALAEIYVVGRGEKPTIGRREDGSGPSGLYGQAVAAVLSILNVDARDVFRPCKAAIDGLTEARMRSLLNAHAPFGSVSLLRMARIASAS